MLTFSSEIHVKPECDRVSVLSLLNDWFLASQLSSKWLSKKQCSPFDIYKNEPEFKESIPGPTMARAKINRGSFICHPGS